MDLQTLQDKLASRKKLREELEKLTQKRTQLEMRLKQEKTNLDYENSDVEALEGNTLKAFFYSAIGKKEERLMKEEDEAAAAKAKYEATRAEWVAVNDRIEQIETDLQKLKYLERDYQNLAKEQSKQVETVKARMSVEDAIALETIQNELAAVENRRAYYHEIIEEGKKLREAIVPLIQALEKMREADLSPFNEIIIEEIQEYAALKEARAQRKVVEEQAEHFKACLAKGVRLSVDYTFDMQSIDNMIEEARIRCRDTRYNSTTRKLLSALPETPDMILNLTALLDEMERKLLRSKQHQTQLELRRAELMQKYQSDSIKTNG